MPNFVKYTLVAVFAFLLPIAVVLTLRWEDAKKYFVVTPESARGKVLFFTSYY